MNCVATQVSIFYDPMIAKLVVWDTDRTSALRRLNASLGHYQVLFPPTRVHERAKEREKRTEKRKQLQY
jgi:acetyl/propionyl-CoA carboxylase alpha subunit